jgi:hypothetical protein
MKLRNVEFIFFSLFAVHNLFQETDMFTMKAVLFVWILCLCRTNSFMPNQKIYHPTHIFQALDKSSSICPLLPTPVDKDSTAEFAMG